MDIAEVALQRIARMDGVGARNVEDEIHRAYCLAHGVHDGKARVGELAGRIRLVSRDRFPNRPNGGNHIAARRLENGLGLPDPGLHLRPVA